MRDPGLRTFLPGGARPCTAMFALFLLVALPAANAYASPSIFPTEVTISVPNKYQQGFYTLYTSPPDKTVFMIDMDGNVASTWTNPDGPGTAAIGEVIKPAPNGGILTYLRVDPNDSKRRRIVELSMTGEIVWEYFNADVPTLNHDFQRLPNGNVLILGSQDVLAPQVAPVEIKDDIIFEVNRKKQVVWWWSTADHYAQLGLSDEAKQIIADREIVPQNNEGDVFHTNSIQSLPPNPTADADVRFTKGNILVSQRNTNLIFVIDKSTGNIVWKMSGRTVGQHHVKMIPWPLKGAGNILLFDNGGWAGYPRKYAFNSRVIEIEPVTKQIVWEYDATLSQNHKRSFFSPFRGSAQRMPNGNTVITEAEWGRIFEVTKKGEIVWEYVNPHFKTKGKRGNRIYRGLRFSQEWLNLDNYKYWW